MGVRPALIKEKEAESDSSDDSSDDEPLSKRVELREALKGPKSKGLKGLQLPEARVSSERHDTAYPGASQAVS